MWRTASWRQLLKILLLNKSLSFPQIEVDYPGHPPLAAHPLIKQHITHQEETYSDLGSKEYRLPRSTLLGSQFTVSFPSVYTYLAHDVLFQCESGAVFLLHRVENQKPQLRGLRAGAVSHSSRDSVLYRPRRALLFGNKIDTSLRHQVVIPGFSAVAGVHHSHFLVDSLPYILRATHFAAKLTNDRPFFVVPDSIPSWMEFYLSRIDAKIFKPSRNSYLLTNAILTPREKMYPDPRDIELVRAYVFEKLVSKSAVTSDRYPTKILISRKKSQRYTENLALMEERCIRAGFIEIEPQSLKPEEMIALAHNALVIAGATGNNQHHILWSRPGAYLLDLLDSGFWQPFNFLLADYLQIKYVPASAVNLPQILTTL